MVIFSVDVGVSVVIVSFLVVDDVVSAVSGNAVVDVVIFSVDVVGVSDVDVSFSIVNVVNGDDVGVRDVLSVVDISSVDEVVVSDNVIILSVVVDPDEYNVLCVVAACSSVHTLSSRKRKKINRMYYTER